MPALRFADLEAKPTTLLDMTSLTLDEFRHLVPTFEAAFVAHMAEWRLDGKRRTARRYSTYTNCPLPAPEDRLLFILIYMKTNPLHVAHGLVFDLPKAKPINGSTSCCQCCGPRSANSGMHPHVRLRRSRSGLRSLSVSKTSLLTVRPPTKRLPPPFLPRWHRTTHPTPPRSH